MKEKNWPTKRYSNREIENEIRAFYDEAVQSVQVPPVPKESSYGKRGFRENKGPVTFQFALPRVAAALLLIAFGSFFFVRPVMANPLAETIAYLAEENKLHEKITSGLQRAGHFISNTLEKSEQGENQ